MSETSVHEAPDIPKALLTKAPKSKTRVTFASLPRELRDKIYEEMVNVHKIICTLFARDFGCPEEWETMRAMFRASPASENLAIEAYETFFRTNTFQAKDYNYRFLTRKTYYVRGYGWSDMMSSVGKIRIEHSLRTSSPDPNPPIRQLHSLLACPRLFHVTVVVLLPNENLTSKQRLLPQPLYRQLASTDKTLFAITQVCRELIEKIGEGLIFEAKDPQAEERIKNWVQYMKVCRELREKTCRNLKSNISFSKREYATSLQDSSFPVSAPRLVGRFFSGHPSLFSVHSNAKSR